MIVVLNACPLSLRRHLLLHVHMLIGRDTQSGVRGPTLFCGLSRNLVLGFGSRIQFKLYFLVISTSRFGFFNVCELNQAVGSKWAHGAVESIICLEGWIIYIKGERNDTILTWTKLMGSILRHSTFWLSCTLKLQFGVIFRSSPILFMFFGFPFLIYHFAMVLEKLILK